MNSFWHPSDDNAQEKAYQFIKEAIIGFQLKPDQRLIAAELATALGASRTPIREALSRLEQEGLVTRAGGWGYLVRSMQITDVLEMYKVREALELEALTEAFPNLDDGLKAQLRKALEKARKCKSSAVKFVALNRVFHNMIASATHNELLRYMLSFIGDRVKLTGAMAIMQAPERMAEVIAENFAILDAIEAGDLPAALAAAQLHIRNGRDHVVRTLEHNRGRLLSTPR